MMIQELSAEKCAHLVIIRYKITNILQIRVKECLENNCQHQKSHGPDLSGEIINLRRLLHLFPVHAVRNLYPHSQLAHGTMFHREKEVNMSNKMGTVS
jgi:hypothetical protein